MMTVSLSNIMPGTKIFSGSATEKAGGASADTRAVMARSGTGVAPTKRVIGGEASQSFHKAPILARKLSARFNNST